VDELSADKVIYDLEDAVSDHDKPTARDRLKRISNAGLVRINALTSRHGADDLRSLVGADFDGVVLPKTNSLDDVLQLEAVMDALGQFETHQIWVMIETALGVVNVHQILSHPRVTGCIVGTNDLAVDLGCGDDPRAAMTVALQSVVLAARAHGKLCLDGVYNAFRDADGFRAECDHGRALGFDGKTLIHPAQIDIANTVFGATAQEIARAKRIVNAFHANDSAVIDLDGQMIEELHAKQAQSILDAAQE